MEVIEKHKSSPAFEDRFRSLWNIPEGVDLDKVIIGTPYEYFVVDLSATLAFASSDDADIMSVARRMSIGFPMRFDGRFIGTILVAENETPAGTKINPQSGEYTYVGGLMADDDRERDFLMLRREIASSMPDHVVCKLLISPVAPFIAVLSDSGIESVGGASELAASLIGSSGGDPSLVEYRRAGRLLKEACREVQKSIDERTVESSE